MELFDRNNQEPLASQGFVSAEKSSMSIRKEIFTITYN